MNSTSVAPTPASTSPSVARIHYCLGASLAKLEGQVAIGGFLRRFPGARVVGEPVWNGRMNLRGLDELAVDVS